MKSPEEKAEMLRQQVNSKVLWGARDQEVYDFLFERHGIGGEEAEAMLTAAHVAKRKAVRTKALILIATSLVGIAFAGVFVGLQIYGGVFVIGKGSILILGVGVFSIGVFLRNVWRLFTGHMHGSVE